MSYSTDHLRTAGKITVYTTLIGVVAFAFIFMFNIGEREIKQAVAQDSATTTVTVLNIAPFWTATTTELIESSSNNPTNEGDQVTWIGTATDSNNEDYWLLICSTSATPTPNSSAPPTCSSGVQWARSATTTSGTQATAATTTTASTSPFAGESFNWYAWICDANAVSPKCNTIYTQGTNATNSSPFEVNHRPTFTAFVSPVAGNPGQTVTFTSTSDDDDVSGTPDTVYITVCATAGFSTTTNSCTGTTLATSTAYVSSNATSSYTIVIPTQDQNYAVYPYIIDSHGLEALGGSQGVAGVLTVNNVAPTINPTQVSLVQATTTDMYLTVESGETTGFTLSFVTTDNNSCTNSLNTHEVINYQLSIYRSGTGPINSSSTTCPVTGPYDANNCYPSTVGTGVWNLSCTPAATTTCSAGTDITWNCTFPLWYIADPTDGTATSTQYSTNDWRAQIQAIDDDSATGSPSESSGGVEVKSFLAFALNTLSIPYGALEPGSETPLLVATTTIAATGNVGLDKDVEGTDMCTTYTGLTPCPVSSTSTIPAFEQVVGTSTVSYAQGTPISSTSTLFVDINVPKTRATSTASTSNAYWGIRVPGTITLAGDYTGENTFTARVSDSSQW